MKNNSAYWQYHWWMYVLLAVIVVIVWCYLFFLVAQPSANEKLHIVVFDKNFNTTQLQRDLQNDISQITLQHLEKVQVEKQSDLGESIHNVVIARLITADLIVLPQSLITTQKEDATKIRIENFLELPTQKLEEMVGRAEYYSVDGKPYGIYLNADDGVTNNFEKYYTGTERCVLFLCDQSANLNCLFGMGNSGDSAGIDTLKYLLEVANG